MSAPLQVRIEGIGLWSPMLPDWQTSRSVLQGVSAGVADLVTRPAPALLAATERRRAPESVLLAIEVAQQACTMAARDPALLPTVFASAYGDLAINDHLCASLARAPRELSPTKFHNSVHNAAAGYWAIATGCTASATALSAGAASFGAGLLEAALLACAESMPTLLVAYDIAAFAPLSDVVDCTIPFAVAFVLAPALERAGADLHLSLQAGASAELAPDASLLHAVYRANPAARCLPLLIALACGQERAIELAAGPQLKLHMEISSWRS